MTVKKKIIFTVFTVVSFFLLLQIIIDYNYLLPTLKKIETESAAKDIKRTVLVIKGELDHLNAHCRSWSEWNASYQFVKDLNPEFIASNLQEKNFANNQLSLIFFLDPGGRVLWGRSYSQEMSEFISIREFPEHGRPLYHHLLNLRQKGSAVAGYMKTSEGIMMIAARPILLSSGEGSVRGTLVIGRLFCDHCIGMLRDRTQADIDLWPMDSDALTPTACSVKKILSQGNSTFIECDKDWIYGYTVFTDFFNRPVLLLRTKSWRTIYKSFIGGLVTDLIFNLLAAVLLVFLLCYFLQRSVGRPLALFSREIAEIKSGNQMKRVTVHSEEDEIRQLQLEFNRMARRLGEDARQREQIKADLKVSKESLKAVLNAAPDGILTLNERGIIKSANPVAEFMLGYPQGGLPGHKIFSLVACEQQELLRDEIVTFRRRPESSVFALGVEVSACHLDGSSLLVHCKASSVKIGGKNLCICIVRDVSGLKEIHDILMRTKHLASIGEMGASIAHEIRNPLAGISGAVQVLSDLSSADKPDYPVLKEIRQLTERIEETVVRMLEYAKDWQLNPELCLVTALVRDTFADYKRQAGLEHLDITIDGADDIRALLDRDLIGQVLVNLIRNTVDACGGESGKIVCKVRKNMREVYITLEDNGSGIKDDVKEDIFKPFFTTKESGNGLGLAICQKIIEKHNGEISLESQVGIGTKVTIILPKSKFLKA